MFLLREATVDYKWRLTIPSATADRESLMEEDEVFLSTREDGCLEIYFTQSSASLSFSRAPVIRIKIIQNKKDNQVRLIIPAVFRGLTSFFYGRNITIADFGKKIELWPRP